MKNADEFSGEFQLAALCDARLARHAVAARPAWLWSIDGLRIYWANAAGADVFGAASGAELARQPRSPADRGGRQVARLAGHLTSEGPIRFERLTGFGAALGGLTTCACMRIKLNGATDGILVVGVDPPVRVLPQADRLARLLDGIDAPLAIFAADGHLVAATPTAGAAVANATTLADLGDNLAQISLGDGDETAIVAVIPPKLKATPKPPANIAPVAASTAIPPDRRPALLDDEPSSPITEPVSASSDSSSAAAMLNLPDLSTMDAEAIEEYLLEQDLIADARAAEALYAQAASRSNERLHAEAADRSDLSPAPAPAHNDMTDAGPQTPSSLAPTADKGLHMPLRFVWQTDAGNHFTLPDSEFSHLVGPAVMAQMGRPWSDMADALGLDPAGDIARALATHETWTGLVANWPVASGGRIAAELSGIPVYDAERNFAGFRGFGICRDAALAELTASQEAATEKAEDNSPAVRDEPPAIMSEPPALMTQPANVVPFRSASADHKMPVLTPVENSAFNEIARQLSARLEGKAANDSPPPLPVDTEAAPHSAANDESLATDSGSDQAAVATALVETPLEPAPAVAAPAASLYSPRGGSAQERTLLERLPFGILVYRLDRLLFANPAFLERTGYASLHDLNEAGGLDALYVEPGVANGSSTSEGGTPLRVAATDADPTPSDARLISMNWDDDAALALVLLPATGASAAPVASTVPAAAVEPPAAPPVVTTEAPPAAPAESELAQARRETNRVANAKADLLARISHDIRAPLSAITGFAEMMIEQRFGPLGNERYAEYMKDIRASGERVAAIVNDLLDVSQIEAGQVALAFTANDLNHVVEQCVAAMQPRANRERIIIRSSLARALPPVIADARSLRQITLMLMTSALAMSRTGAQIIVSTALGDDGDVALRLRDAGHVMSESEIETVMDPLGRGPREDGTASLDLSVARALVSANRAHLNIRSAAQTGTLIEVIFPASDKRVSYAN